MPDDTSPLESKIRRLIATAGPMPVAEYMAHCLGDAGHGYYMTQEPLGSAGDFITAPEISQIFGELIGLWAAAVWDQMGSPADVGLVELGPGRGTMMQDMLRAVRIVPTFRQALSVHLVETSPLLRRHQQQTLADQDVSILWHDALANVPDGPAIIVANEFFDALPIHQAVKQENGWHERVVGTNGSGKLKFAIAPEPLHAFDRMLPAQVRTAETGAIYEWRTDTYAREVGQRFVRDGGAALIIDYGHVRSDVGDTLQAVRSHRKSDPFAAPGLADITAHVDFQALGRAAESTGARVHGPVEQAVLLRRLGIEQRAAKLKTAAVPSKATAIDAALARLLAGGPTGMGTMFKAIGLSAPQLATLPGFEA
jgi:NADH dehydrogenase [ubiquinone] 1 alpha subcomplex assembly factor 7